MLLVFEGMQLFLFRHAERDVLDPNDPALTARGWRQAQQLADQVQDGRLPSPKSLFVSPRKRAQQTFSKLAEQSGIPSVVVPELDERQSHETAAHFQARVRRLVTAVAKQKGPLYLCTHLDWLEEALIAIPSDVDLLQGEFHSWQTAQYIEFYLQDGLWLFRKSGRME